MSSCEGHFGRKSFTTNLDVFVNQVERVTVGKYHKNIFITIFIDHIFLLPSLKQILQRKYSTIGREEQLSHSKKNNEFKFKILIYIYNLKF